MLAYMKLDSLFNKIWNYMRHIIICIAITAIIGTPQSKYVFWPRKIFCSSNWPIKFRICKSQNEWAMLQCSYVWFQLQLWQFRFCITDGFLGWTLPGNDLWVMTSDDSHYQAASQYYVRMRPIVTDRVAWSVGLLICHTSEPCKNGWSDRDTV